MICERRGIRKKKQEWDGKERGEEMRRWWGEIITNRSGRFKYIFPRAFTVSGKKRLSEASVIGWGIVPDKREFHEC